MSHQTFEEYLKATFNIKNSGSASSYIRAIQILDELFKQNDVFGLNNHSLSELKDPELTQLITDFVIEEEDKFKHNKNSFFDLINTRQTSYPKKGFCRAAMRKLGDYVNLSLHEEVAQLMIACNQDGQKLSTKLSKKFNINDKGTEIEVRAKQRVGQNIFRAMLLEIYDSKCCITGLDLPEVLRASHIIPWSENKTNRLNPCNGLCLSATYDAAFDKHLISLDEDYRLILSPSIKEFYTSASCKRYFLDYEGRHITLPCSYFPSQTFLERHREQLVS